MSVMWMEGIGKMKNAVSKSSKRQLNYALPTRSRHSAGFTDSENAYKMAIARARYLELNTAPKGSNSHDAAALLQQHTYQPQRISKSSIRSNGSFPLLPACWAVSVTDCRARPSTENLRGFCRSVCGNFFSFPAHHIAKFCRFTESRVAQRRVEKRQRPAVALVAT